MTASTVIGVDPGKTGAIAAVDVATRGLIWCEDMPLTTHVNGRGIAELYAREPGAPVVIEHVKYNGNTPNGGQAWFSLGDSFAGARCVAEALGREVVLYTPRVWKAVLRLTSDKNLSRQTASNRWPEMAYLFDRKQDADRAEAALIALVHVDHLRRTIVADQLDPVALGMPW